MAFITAQTSAKKHFDLTAEDAEHAEKPFKTKPELQVKKLCLRILIKLQKK